MNELHEAGSNLAIMMEALTGDHTHANAVLLYAVALCVASHETPDEYLEKTIKALRMQVAAMQFAAEKGEAN